MKENYLWSLTANESEPNNIYPDDAEAKTYWDSMDSIVGDKKLSGREKALKLKEAFPSFSVKRMIEATGWKRYKWWILPDVTRNKISSKQKTYRLKRKDFLSKIKKKFNGCGKCGYNICDAALEFHHLDPSEKDFKISSMTKEKDIIKEVEKCVLLCSNCHREFHAGLFNL